jgi:hypothetical protein
MKLPAVSPVTPVLMMRLWLEPDCVGMPVASVAANQFIEVAGLSVNVLAPDRSRSHPQSAAAPLHPVRLSTGGTAQEIV